MGKLITLNLDYKIKVSSRLHNFLDPDIVYFPISKNSKILVKNKEKVLKDQALIQNNHQLVFSSISGSVIGVKKFLINKEEMLHLAILNDYKEKSVSKNIKKIIKPDDKEKFIELLKQYNINLSINDKKVLLLKVIDKEPYIINNSFYFTKNIKKIFEVLDILKEMFAFEKVIILIKNTETDALTKINNILGTYPDFKINTVPNYYLIDRKTNYENYLSEMLANTFELSLQDYQKIAEVLEKGKPLTEKYITITGDIIEKPIVVNTKYGANLEHILEGINININKNESIFYINGLLSGNIDDPKNVIVDDLFEGVIITKEKQYEEKECIKCGLCHKYCPLDIDPIEEKNQNKKIKCLNCGLCSYICPSNISFKNETIKDDLYE